MAGLPADRAPRTDRQRCGRGDWLLTLNRRVVLLRHGRTSWNNAGRFQGQTDIPLDELGVRQAERAGTVLAELDPHTIVSSDLVRARLTAEPLAAACGLEVMTDPGLRETFAGEWEGLTHAEIRERYGSALDEWSAGAAVRPGGGETREEVADRVADSVARALTRVPEGRCLVVVTHGGAARAGIGRLLALPEPSWAALGVLANCSWSVLTETAFGPAGPAWRLAEYNAASLPVKVVGDDR